jgi:hypothetical protein
MQAAEMPMAQAHAQHRLWVAMAHLANGFRDGAIF